MRIVDDQNWHKSRFPGQTRQTGQTDCVNWSDRSGQLHQIVNWTIPLHRSRRDDRNAYMERPIWSPDEKVMPPEIHVPQSDWSIDRSGTPSPR